MAKKCLLSLLAALVAATGFAAPRYLVIPRPGVGAEALAASRGWSVLESYERGIWVEGPMDRVDSADAFVKPYPEWDLIRTVAPFRISERPALQGLVKGGLYIVHYRAPMKTEWNRALRSLPGVTVVQSLPSFAQIVHVADTAVNLAGLQGVDWSGRLQPDWRISPRLSEAVPGTRADVILMVANTTGVEATLHQLRELGVRLGTPRATSAPWMALRAQCSSELVDEAAALEHVLWIEPAPVYVLHDERQAMAQAGLMTGWLPDPAAYTSWLSSVGLGDLSNVVIDVADDGWDSGDLTLGNHHPDFDTADGSASRMLYTIDLCGDGPQGAGGHGTLNQSIVLGDGTGTAEVDGDGYTYGTGIAPTARGGHTKIFPDDPDGGFCPATMTEITAGAQANGAQIANNSWGAPTFGVYSVDSAEYDLLVRDADNDWTNGLQELTVVFSAGNQGPSAGTVGSPGTAKNVITSGAAENVRDDGVVDGCSDSDADSFQDLSDFSSRGPCADGRRKPDAVAPGRHVQGAASQFSGFTGATVCGSQDNDFVAPPDDAYYPAGQTWYTWSSGTSHSAPGMAGMAALIYEWYRNRNGAAPSPAMNKAIMLASGTDMNGGNDGGGGVLSTIPNSQQGWGFVNMGRVVDGTTMFFFDQEHLFTEAGQSFAPVPRFKVVDPAKPVRIMMVYTDAPGNPNATPSGQLGNDLDLEVTAGGSVYLGNVFSGGVSQPGGTPDATNNVEAVYLPAGAVSEFSLRVLATDLSADAIPGDGTDTEQDFALYVYNASGLTSAGALEVDSSAYSCSGMVHVKVSDEDLRSAGAQNVSVRSTTETTPETVSLTESPAGSGVFVGSVTLTSDPAAGADGLLSVAHGDLISASYLDLDDGSGSTVTTTATADVDCAGPVISAVTVPAAGLRDSSAVVSWATDEPATSVLFFGSSAPPARETMVWGTRTAHSLQATGLDPCTDHVFSVTSCDDVGNCTTDNHLGSYYTFSTGQEDELFADDVEGGNIGWSAASPWAISAEASHSASHAWSDSPGGNYGYWADVSLTSPPLDLSAASAVTLRFSHTYEIESGYDFGYVEASANGGPWTVLATYSGEQPGWTQEQLDLGDYAGLASLQLRFRLASDGLYNFDGWHLDDVAVVHFPSCSTGTVALDRELYECADTAAVTVVDFDLDTDPDLVETVAVALSSDTEATPEILILSEQSSSSPSFTGAMPVRSVATAGDGLLGVAHGDSIVVTYFDEDDGTGGSATLTASAIVDCEGPVISNLTTVDITPTQATARWDTDELADSAVSWFEVFSGIPGTAVESAMTLSHDLDLTGLTPCTPYLLRANSTDSAGHTSTSGWHDFSTIGGSDDTISASGLPLAIPDGDTVIGQSSTVTVAATGPVLDVNVALSISHGWDSDLDIYLEGPDGTTIALSTDNGGSGANYTNTVFDDEAATPITDGSAPFTGSFVPEQPLSTFDGLAAAGDWVLHLYDDTSVDSGTLDAWQLRVVSGGPCGWTDLIFGSGLEIGTTGRWSSAQP